MIRKNSAVPAVLAVLASMSSCVSLHDSMLLSYDVDPAYQSAAIVSAGIDAYREKLIARGDLSAFADVERYFEAALRYDPDNVEAARYLALVEVYRARRFSESVKNAEALLKKTTRNSDDDYSMLASVRSAVTIYPRDESADALLKATQSVRAAYIAGSLSEAATIRASLTPETKEAAMERGYIAAFNLVSRVRDVEPRDGQGASAYRELKADVADIVEKRLASVDSLISKSSFTEARSILSVVAELDSKIGGAFNADIQKATYRMYLAWARYHEARKEWPEAAARIRSALAIQKGGDALALQKRIAASVAAGERGATFSTGLKNLDGYIAKGEFVKAQLLLASLSKSSSDSAQRRELDQRRTTILEALKGIYAAGVEAYRNEKFKDAIGYLETVVFVDAAYEEASEYLEKARAKQRLLDQY